MILDCPNAEALSQVALDDGWARVAEFEFSGATVSGIVELGRTAYHGGASACAAAERCLTRVPEAGHLLRSVFTMLRGNFESMRPHAHLFSAPEREIWLVRSSSCIESNEFSLFVQRFRRSLEQAGFGQRFPYALSQALTEMTENVVRHSAANGGSPALGLVGFHVVREEMNYVVADLGRGALGSLRENPKWAHLKTESDALVAAAKRGATRLPQHTEGDGFRLAFQAFLDRQGIIAMRSGDGLARIQGNANGREAEMSNTAPVPGLRVSAWCDLNGQTKEIQIHS